jgi:hypothetical protein
MHSLLELPELGSAEAMLTSAPRVTFFRPDGGTGLVAGETALPVYRLGLTCFIGCAHIPALMEAAERLAADLGMPSGSMTCEAFCSDGEGGVSMHSDHDVNFAVLVRGRKRWQIAENRHIRNQTAVCRPVSHEQHDPGQLELADELPFPEQMSADSRTVDMEAGGLLFLPRGWWHQTESSGECLQINFVLNRPMWLDIVVRALGRRLKQDPEWRAFAFDVFGPPERRERAMAEFGALLSELHHSLDTEDWPALAAELVERAGLKPAGERASAGSQPSPRAPGSTSPLS